MYTYIKRQKQPNSNCSSERWCQETAFAIDLTSEAEYSAGKNVEQRPDLWNILKNTILLNCYFLKNKLLKKINVKKHFFGLIVRKKDKKILKTKRRIWIPHKNVLK